MPDLFDISSRFNPDWGAALIQRMRDFSLLRTRLDNGENPATLTVSSHKTTARLASLVARDYYGEREPFDVVDLIERLDVDGQRELRDYLFPGLAGTS